MNAIASYFKFQERGTTFGTEVRAGLTTFAVMAYIVFLNPIILSTAGIDVAAAAAATALVAGVITILMAREVGEKGKVMAIDIQKEMLVLLGDKLSRIGLKNVELVLGTEKSPKLQPNSIDLALMVDVYHEFKFPFEMMEELSKSLKPGGRIAFVEYRREDPDVPIKLVHKMSEAQVKLEVAQPEFGLKWKETIKDLPRQHIIIFEKPIEAAKE